VLFEGAVDFQIAPVLNANDVMIVGLASKALENFSSELRRASSAAYAPRQWRSHHPPFAMRHMSSDQVTGRAWESKPTAPAITPPHREWNQQDGLHSRLRKLPLRDSYSGIVTRRIDSDDLSARSLDSLQGMEPNAHSDKHWFAAQPWGRTIRGSRSRWFAPAKY